MISYRPQICCCSSSPPGQSVYPSQNHVSGRHRLRTDESHLKLPSSHSVKATEKRLGTILAYNVVCNVCRAYIFPSKYILEIYVHTHEGRRKLLAIGPAPLIKITKRQNLEHYVSDILKNNKYIYILVRIEPY